ncbi:MAG: hypothetical protein V1748_13560 [Actinomycetota bacterium]
MWFADLLERLGLYDVTFVAEEEVTPEGLSRFGVLMVGGGDTYAMAEGMGPGGAGALEGFVRSGGFYHGSCAGGYLVLRGVDRPPFTPFALVDGEMVNVMGSPPEPRCLEHKYLAPYGPDWVFHPVYGEVVLGPGTGGPGFECFEGGEIAAPLFGGPVIASMSSVADFTGVSDRAAFLWPRDEAERLLEGRRAVVRASLGGGTAVASGPHLEHPLFVGANTLLAELLLRHLKEAPADTGAPSGRAPSTTPPHGPNPTASTAQVETLLAEIRRQVSNARIVGFGLEKMPVTWRIGVKVWEPEKIRTFLDYAWRRLPYLYARALYLDPADLEPLAAGYAEVTRLARSLKITIESDIDSQPEAQSLLTRLKELTASFLSLYFRLRLEARGNHD